MWWFVSIGGFGAERSNPVLEKNIRQDTYLEDLFWTIMITRELSWSLEDLGFTSGPVALAPTSCPYTYIVHMCAAHQRQASANEQEVTICLVMSSSHFPQQPGAENEEKLCHSKFHTDTNMSTKNHNIRLIEEKCVCPIFVIDAWKTRCVIL